MKSKNRCVACGRRRKPGHEKRCGTPKAYSPDCQKYEDFDMKAYLVKQEAKKAEAQKQVAVETPAVETPAVENVVAEVSAPEVSNT